jgi:DNA-binding CsgD family transcriptional regulator
MLRGGGGTDDENNALWSILAPGCAGNKTALLQRLMPYLQRAVGLHRRLSATRLPGLAALASLDLLPTAVWLLGAKAGLLHANLAAKRLTQRGDVIALDLNGELHACVAMEDRRLQQLIGGVLHAGSRTAAEAGMTFMMLGNNGNGMLHMMAAPLTGGQYGVGEMAAVFATCLSSLPPDLEPNLRRFYSLTPMEARLAAALVAGDSTQEFAGRARIAEETARSHMKHILAKTGARRQADLVRIIVTGPAMLCCPAGK